MNGHVTTEINGRTYYGEYTLRGGVCTVTLHGKSRAAPVGHGPIMLLTRRMLRELALAEPDGIT